MPSAHKVGIGRRCRPVQPLAARAHRCSAKFAALTLPLQFEPASGVKLAMDHERCIHEAASGDGLLFLGTNVLGCSTGSAAVREVCALAPPPPARLYLWLEGNAEECVTSSTLRDLGRLYEAVTVAAPTRDVVPLLPAAGWALPAALADRLPGIARVYALPEDARLAEGVAAQLGAQCTLQLLHPAPEAPQPPSSSPQPPSAQPQQQQTTSAASGGGGGGLDTPSAAGSTAASFGRVIVAGDATPGPLRYERVAVGGTFDRLHAGHRLLLAATAALSSRYVFVGVTSDALLANKRAAHLLQTYEARRDAAVDFLLAVHPVLDIHTGALADPAAATAAETDPAMQALVVSHETLPGGLAINAARQRRGFAPLDLVVVALVGLDAESGAKLSSTALREAEQAAAKQAAGK